MIYIRADGNTSIGTGHVMRTLSIAQAAVRCGISCTFITADRKMESMISENGFPLICLNTEWNNLDCETALMEELILRRDIKTLIIDSYFVTADYLLRLNKLTHTAYLDDLNAFHYPCDTLINYNLYASHIDYTSRYAATDLLLGPSYAPLRMEFQKLPGRKVNRMMQSVLVTTGGADPSNLAGQLVSMAKQDPSLSDLTYHIVAGKFNQHRSELESLSNREPGVVLHKNASDMARLMLDCDAAISAGGSTVYELLATGTPSIILCYADNQERLLASLDDSIMYNAGDARTSFDRCAATVLQHLRSFRSSFKLRHALSLECQKLVDGLGADRIVKSLLRSPL